MWPRIGRLCSHLQLSDRSPPQLLKRTANQNEMNQHECGARHAYARWLLGHSTVVLTANKGLAPIPRGRGRGRQALLLERTGGQKIANDERVGNTM